MAVLLERTSLLKDRLGEVGDADADGLGRVTLPCVVELTTATRRRRDALDERG